MVLDVIITTIKEVCFYAVLLFGVVSFLGLLSLGAFSIWNKVLTFIIHKYDLYVKVQAFIEEEVSRRNAK